MGYLTRIPSTGRSPDSEPESQLLCRQRLYPSQDCSSSHPAGTCPGRGRARGEEPRPLSRGPLAESSPPCPPGHPGNRWMRRSLRQHWRAEDRRPANHEKGSSPLSLGAFVLRGTKTSAKVLKQPRDPCPYVHFGACCQSAQAQGSQHTRTSEANMPLQEHPTSQLTPFLSVRSDRLPLPSPRGLSSTWHVSST